MVINKNSSNNIACTFSEKALYANSEWLIKFTNDINGANGSKVVAVNDTSLYKSRSNRFIIVESSVEDLPNGTVNLSPVGSWNYTAYEMTPSSPRDMNISNAIKIVEIGICEVKDPNAVEPVTFKTDNAKNNYTFKD